MFEILNGMGLLGLTSIIITLYHPIRETHKRPVSTNIILGIMFGGAASIVMLDPVFIPPGSIFDTRGGPAMLVGLYGGPVATIIASLIGAATRLYVGGSAAVGGAVSFALYGAFGIAVGYYFKKINKRPNLLNFVSIAILGSIVVIPSFFVLQSFDVAIMILQKAGWMLLVGNIAGTVILGMLLELDWKRWKTDIKIQGQSDFLKSVIDAQPSHMAVVDKNGTIINVNEKWHEFADKNNASSPNHWLGQNYFELCSSDDDDMLEHIKDVIEGRQNTYEHLYLSPSPNGESWFSLLVYPLKTESFSGAIIMHLDVTDRILAERKAGLENLKYRNLVENAVVAILTTDDRGNILTANKTVTEMFGFPSQDLIGHNVSILMGGHHRKAHSRYIKQQQEGMKSRIVGVGREVDAMHKSGHVFPIRIAISETTFQDEMTYTAVIIDISKQRETLKNLITARKIAEEASMRKNQFLSSMSHELRTPLNSILGFGQLLSSSKRTPLDQRQSEQVEQILASGSHLLSLINEVLDLSSTETGQITISLQDVSLNDVFYDCLHMVEAQAAINNVTLIDKTDHDQEITAYTDYKRVKQVVINLLSNAIKYNRKQGGSVTLRCHVTDQKNIHIDVIDNGFGIAPENLDHIFEPFNRIGKEKSDIEGTGVGLSLCKNLMESLGGQIGVSSTLDVGSVFWLELPKSETQIKHTSQTLAKLVSREVSTDLKRVLYVEDNLFNQNLMIALTDEIPNIDLSLTSTAEEGIEVAIIEQPDLIILDINLPGMSGIEALEHLKRNPDTASIPVFALSANATADGINQGMEAGFKEYFTKPFDINKMFDALSKI